MLHQSNKNKLQMYNRPLLLMVFKESCGSMGIGPRRRKLLVYTIYRIHFISQTKHVTNVGLYRPSVVVAKQSKLQVYIGL